MDKNKKLYQLACPKVVIPIKNLSRQDIYKIQREVKQDFEKVNLFVFI